MLQRIHWTRNSELDLAISDHDIDDNDDEWHVAVKDHKGLFDVVGNYRNLQGIVAEEVHHSRQIKVNES